MKRHIERKIIGILGAVTALTLADAASLGATPAFAAVQTIADAKTFLSDDKTSLSDAKASPAVDTRETPNLQLALMAGGDELLYREYHHPQHWRPWRHRYHRPYRRYEHDW